MIIGLSGIVGFCVLVVLVLSSSIASAQNTNATITGQILDPSEALVPKARVVIVNQETGVTVFTGLTDSAGAFTAPQVPPGTYKITIITPGLKTAVIGNLIATVAQVTSVNVRMEIGQTEEVVEIVGNSEELDRSTSDISTVIAPSEVQNLPLQRRTTENLMALVPGATHGGAADSPNLSQLSINGSRTLNTEVLLNGVSTIVASTGNIVTLPSPDGVSEFRVLATNAPAEYGRTSGAVASISTISGTNAYHGNLYFLMRNEDLDANTFFNNARISSVTGESTPRPRDRFFQAGGSLGGPVKISHLYNGRNKTFFFVNYDYTNQPNPTVVTETVPTAAERIGDFSAALATTDLNGNPRKPQQTFLPGGTKTAAFTNNQVTGLNPAAVQILALLPLPNTVGIYDPTNNRFTNNWTQQQNLTAQTLRIASRLDEQITSNDRLTFNVYRFDTTSPRPIFWDNPLLNTNYDCDCSNAWLPSVEYTRVLSPTLVMDLNFGYFRNAVFRNPPGAGMNASQQLRIASLPLDQTPD